MMALFSTGIAVWVAVRWMFRTLQAFSTKRDARAVATLFVVLSPVWLGIAILLGGGGYAAEFLEYPFGRAGAFVGLFGGFVVVAAIASFAICLITFRNTRCIVRVEAMYPLDTTN
jgi:ABC-type molybdate transport system permease subunit